MYSYHTFVQQFIPLMSQGCGGWVQVREYLEKHYEEKSGMEAVKLAIRALTETVEAGSKNIEVGGCCLV